MLSEWAARTRATGFPPRLLARHDPRNETTGEAHVPMLTLKTIRRVTVYSSKALEDTLVSRCLSLGANGYTITDCRGHGTHPVPEDPMTNSTHVRMELLVQPDVADKILIFLQSDHLRSHAVAACVEDVQVPSTEGY